MAVTFLGTVTRFWKDGGQDEILVLDEADVAGPSNAQEDPVFEASDFGPIPFDVDASDEYA